MTWAVKNRGVKAAALRKDLAEAQRLGYSLSSHGAGEITDIAVPIREPSGKAIAAIAVRGLSLNNRRSLKSVIAVSKETASTIETVVRENPGDFVNPYAHLPWQAVELPQLPAIR
jgi:DNA-binding IclR family transcriptional regulator